MLPGAGDKTFNINMSVRDDNLIPSLTGKRGIMKTLICLGTATLGFVIGKFIKDYVKRSYTIASGKVPFYELICAAAVYINIYVSGFNLKLIELCIFSIFIITIGFIDFYLKIIPDKIVCLFAVVGLIFAVLNNIDHPRGIFDNLIGAVSASIILFTVSLFSNGSIGGGDIKFTATAGIFLGWKLSIVALAAALFFAGVVLTPLLIIKKVDKEDVVALGPFLAAGMYAASLLL